MKVKINQEHRFNWIDKSLNGNIDDKMIYVISVTLKANQRLKYHMQNRIITILIKNSI